MSFFLKNKWTGLIHVPASPIQEGVLNFDSTGCHEYILLLTMSSSVLLLAERNAV